MLTRDPARAPQASTTGLRAVGELLKSTPSRQLLGPVISAMEAL